MKMSEKDLAFDAFLEAAHQHAPDLPDALLKKVYDIQKQHQYSEVNDRDIPLREMERSVISFLDQNKK